MKKSIYRLIKFSILPLLFICYAIYLTGKNTDDFYKRFSSPQQNSLILGSSRAASMNPEIIDKIIHSKYPDAKLYNYAFTWAHSPYGPKYLESIKKKLKSDTKNGVFIITVEPTALMVNKNEPDDPQYYIENDKSVAKTSLVATNPNLEYLLESYNFSITNEVNKKIRSEKNPMIEVSVRDNGQVHGKVIKRFSAEKRKEVNAEKMKELKNRFNDLKISTIRLNYLSKTIDFLKQHGKVMVIRLPVSKIPYDIENSAVPDFDKIILYITMSEKVPYINYNNYPNHYQWIDEVHLEPSSMDKFSGVIAKNIIR
ncbi:hypothetical protein [Chryseobacterium gambrini]|uniref:DUF1574 domain-containing protein n=1 Tax=Chryseobacterium gambrini TaxID=373672 RepID=A0ABM8K3P4_9FLAO|nr:DUF1574 domain-containing protein [Chryseobacterium gambrini]